MPLVDTIAINPILLIVIVGLVGLLVGSFLNVVIYRLPIMMKRDWRNECAEFLNLPAERSQDDGDFNLVFPLSRCPHCSAPIKPYQNIPVISFLVMKGRCAHCHEPIALRYPLIEALTGLCSALIAWRFGYSPEMGAALFMTWALIALSAIDLDHQLLPDSITLPLLWSGLFLSLFNVFADSQSSIIGAIAGYLCLWLVYHGFKLLTGKEGMGYGDFKLLAAFGAWLGWQYLTMIILLSSVTGALIGMAMIIFVRHDKNIPIPFGPYLAIAGWIALLWGDKINQFYLNATGL
ncbi:MAG: A24 family peptidase [Methylicorpusculum sp.]|nr:A24 family peptidase [Methylicorpusculum sp.]MDO8937542.1 A24 family peptidase [Methylicorpusculum sp.]MDP2201347.1 A24 family peptidase [Methylicorpusculum sp.]